MLSAVVRALTTHAAAPVAEGYIGLLGGQGQSHILIIDEPQSVEGKQTKESLKKFYPLFTLHYSATHREAYDIIYRPDAMDAYNQHLVKRIATLGVTLTGSTATKPKARPCLTAMSCAALRT